MKFWKIIVPVTFVAGALTGIWGKSAYDDMTAPQPLSVGDHFSAAVTDVYDADTMTLQDGDQLYKARIWGIDAPERSQRCLQQDEVRTCGLIARDAFRALVLDKDVTCELKAMDNRYDRLVVQCTLDGEDPVSTLVRQGWAFSDTQYADNPYGADERYAQQNGAGIWAMDYMPPKEWRACQAYQRGGAQSPENCLKPLGPNSP